MRREKLLEKDEYMGGRCLKSNKSKKREREREHAKCSQQRDKHKTEKRR